MTWLICAILARFFWAACNLMDQYITRFSGHKSVMGLLIIENVTSLPIIIVMALVMDDPISIKPSSLVWLSVGVVANLFALFPYLLALKTDDAHSAVPLHEIIPVIVTVLAYFLFGDRLGGIQLLGAALIICGSFLFAWDFKHGHIRLRTLLLMGLSSLCYAVYQLAIRYASHAESVWHVALFVSLGLFISSLVLLILASKPRQLFIQSVRESKGKILVISFAETMSAFIALVCLTIAFARAPATGYVAAVGGIQQVFILLISCGAGFFLPQYYQALVWDKYMKIKCALIGVIVIGVALLAYR